MYKKTVFLYLKALMIVVTIPFLFVYVSDPYMLFHNHWINKGQMYSNFRIQNYGLIKHGHFDSIIIGTSMLENTSANEASQKLGGTWANLSMSGASLFEKFKVTKYALETKQIKHVILSLDYHFSQGHKTNETFYSELYSRNSLIGKIKIYSTDKALKCALKRQECDFIEFNLDRPNAWFNVERHSRRFGGFQNWIKYYEEDNQIQDAFVELQKENINTKLEYKNYKKIIDKEVLPLFSYKNTKFSIVIPPYSVLWWAKRKNDVEKMMKPYEYLAQKTQSFENVEIYWFYDEDFVFNIRNYKDLTHYYYSINSLQLDAIRDGTHILNVSNCQQKFKNFTKKIKRFNLQPYLQKVKKTVKQKNM